MRFRIYLTFFFCLSIFNLLAQTRLKPYDEYIDQYASIAIAQQKQHGIPASITLAQGLLESGAGKSDLAKQSNNHFGIKCHNNWQGETVTFFDDGMNSCFRKYDHVVDSYEDHSQFLLNGSRYDFLFKLDITDYKGWAQGLLKAGYATDRTYADKLIRVIETYNLNDYSKGKAAKPYKELSTESGSPELSKKDLKKAEKAAKELAKKQKLALDLSKNLSNEALKNAKNYHAMENNQTEEVINPLSSHGIFYMGTTPYIVAQYGDSFSGIAEEFGISQNRIRLINEFTGKYQLTPGEFIYLDKKTTWWEGEYPVHKAEKGETMHSISQKYGLQVEALYNLNDMKSGELPQVGQKIKLRNPNQMSNFIRVMSEAVNKQDSIK